MTTSLGTNAVVTRVHRTNIGSVRIGDLFLIIETSQWNTDNHKNYDETKQSKGLIEIRSQKQGHDGPDRTKNIKKTSHYENTPIQIYWKFYNQKWKKNQIKF